LSAWRGKAHHFDGQHREHAGHEVEDKAANQRTDHGGQQGQRRAAARRGGHGGGGIGLERCIQRGRHARQGSQLGPFAEHLEFSTVALRATGQHHGHHRGAVAALGRQWHAGGPYGTLPSLRPCGSGFDDLGGFGEEVQRLSAQAHRQALDRQLQDVAVHAHAAVGHDARGARHDRARLGFGGRVKGGAVDGGRAFDRHLEAELSLFRDALFFAHQPGGLELDLHVLGQHAGFEVGRDGQGHGQKHGAFVAVVGQVANRNFLGQGPGDVACHYPHGQGPFQHGGQAGVAGVFPVGVPFRLMGNLQPHPDFVARRQPLRRVNQQLGPNLVGDDNRFGAALGARHGGDPTQGGQQCGREKTRNSHVAVMSHPGCLKFQGSFRQNPTPRAGWWRIFSLFW
jgi:hypothetical protein